MEAMVKETVDKLRVWLDHFNKPVVLWSGGKDSTAMLHLIRFKIGKNIPVVQWREPRFRHRYAFSDKLVKEWDLEMYDYAPSRVAMTDGYDIETGDIRFDFLKYYQWGKQSALILSLGTEPPKDGEPYLCAIDDIFARPTGSFNWPWDACFHGQKSADKDLIKGDVPLNQDVRFTADSPTQLYPMKEWTDSDVFNYLESEGVEMDPTRYVKTDGIWGHDPDKSSNADYYPVCWNCVNRHEGPSVHCPKLKCQVNNISHLALYEDIVIPEQGFRATWPNTIANDAVPVARTSGAGQFSDETEVMQSESLAK